MAADHFSGHAGDYAKARPSYPPELFAWLARQCASHDLTWDCGTGNGQAARALAEHFHRVHATDLSAEQIAQAEIDPRIDYRAAPAEASGLPGHSCDLVTVAQALHWFCGDAFYAEVRRVLKPGGVFAAWTYTLLHGEPALNAVVEDFYRNTIGPWWPPERRWVDLGYRDMPFPFAEIATPDFEIRLEWTLDDLLAYLRTWSATQRYIRERGTDPCVELAIRLGDAWPDAQARKAIIWPIALRCGRMQ
ncbi:MAG: class I SAM-dependent methyltransferase [Sulfuritalea sp.]|nr:class I SAM-dependent methyltransferase [Sulfuritalea sp.]MBP6637900.1 class I SAM-dependent methyltransferase [Sulfuritalea sp.]MBP7422901.1 class I SAM-dependent methyltransferase [Sulfuritalea sp.]